MAKPIVLWSDLTIKGGATEIKRQFESTCEIRSVGSQMSDAPTLTKGTPKFGVLEYDYPDKQSLALLQQIKRRHPSLPLIMITLAHSEALAVWAFRTGVWDYLTKPLSSYELDRVAARMLSLNQTRSSNSLRKHALVDCEIPLETQYTAKTNANSRVYPAITFVQSNFAEKITEKQVAEICGMTTFRFSRAFHASYGITFREWILKYRLQQAKRLLCNAELSITQVAFMTGFGDASHFGKMFRRLYNQTATEYRGFLDEQKLVEHRESTWYSEADGDHVNHETAQPVGLEARLPGLDNAFHSGFSED